MQADQNFHYTISPKQPRPRWQWIGLGIVGFFLLLNIVAVAVLGYQARSIQTNLTVLQRDATADPSAALATVATLQHEVWWAHRSSAFLLWLRWVPLLGKNIVATNHLLALADSLLTPGAKIAKAVNTLGSLDDIHFSTLTKEQKSTLLEALDQAQPGFTKAQTEVARTQTYLDAHKKTHYIGPVASAVAKVRDLMPVLSTSVPRLAQLADIVPKIVGHNSAQQYLILFANNLELRPGGGFIGSLGTLTFEEGNVTELKTQGVYALDNAYPAAKREKPPWWLTAYLKQNDWHLRDTNTSPDFPTDAMRALDFYGKRTGKNDLAGVISFNPTLVQDLLEITGPIKIAKYGYTFTSKNFTDVLEFHTYTNYKKFGIADNDDDGRKAIISDLSKELRTKLFALPSDKLVKAFDILSTAFAQKHVMMYASDTATQTALEQYGWSGALHKTDGDFLAVYDANMAALNTDSVLDRAINYSVSGTGSDLVATVKITYTNKGTFTTSTTRYRTYTQVVVPEGAQLISHQGAESQDKDATEGYVHITQENGKTFFSYFKSVEPKTAETVTLQYRLPRSVSSQSHYTLYIQKQPGTDASKLTATVRIGNQHTSYTGDLRIDRSLSL